LEGWKFGLLKGDWPGGVADTIEIVATKAMVSGTPTNIYRWQVG